MCYTSAESLCLWSWITLISYLSVFHSVYPEQLNPPTSQQLCLLCRTSWRLHSRTNYRQKCRTHVQRQRNVWNWKSRSRCTGTLGNAVPHKPRCDSFFLLLCIVDMLSMQFTSKPRRKTPVSCENQRIKAFRLLAWEFAFPISEIAMQMQLITWQNLTPKVNPKQQRWLWRNFRKEFPLYVVSTYKHFWIHDLQMNN